MNIKEIMNYSDSLCHKHFFSSGKICLALNLNQGMLWCYYTSSAVLFSALTPALCRLSRNGVGQSPPHVPDILGQRKSFLEDLVL